MTDRIKSAREALDEMKNRTMSHLQQLGVQRDAPVYQNVRKEYETILKALSAYEKLQGVDFDELNSAFAIEEEQNTMYKINLITEFKKIYKRMPTVTYRNAARIVADIGKDI